VRRSLASSHEAAQDPPQATAGADPAPPPRARSRDPPSPAGVSGAVRKLEEALEEPLGDERRAEARSLLAFCRTKLEGR